MKLNFAFQTKNGLVSNRYFNGGADEFSCYWPAGMLYTCGLANVGFPVLDTVINLKGFETSMMILYHCNFGYPLLAPGERMIKGGGEIFDNLRNGLHPEDCGKVAEPLLIQWKNFCAHDYAMGLEPSNSYILGREGERKNGTLPQPAAYESKTLEVAIGVLDGQKEIIDFEKHINFI